MKLTLDPMPVLRDHAAHKVNQHFNALAHDNLHRDHAHAHKRLHAAAIMTLDEAPSAEFKTEASLRGVSVDEFARNVLTKPNHAARRELSRQRLLLRVAAISIPAELELLTSDIAAAIAKMEPI